MKKGFRWILAAVLAAIFAAGGVLAWGFYYDHRVPNFRGRADLYVYPGMTVQEVCDSVLAKGNVLSRRSLARAVAAEKVSVPKPGHYVLDGKMTSTYAARMLKKGWQVPVNLSLNGSIRSRRSLARKIASQMLIDAETLEKQFDNEDFLARFGVDTTSFFTLVIPDTYQIFWTEDASAILERLRQAHDAWWTDERLALARAQNLTPEEVSTLASIVDGETNYEPEMPLIAGVYLNRLREGMPLQADPTVAFCFGYSLSRILKRHLAVDSPYNTYRYAGLPPGPISCPPKTCLEAVLHPQGHGYLYFCASPEFNGSHRFAATYAEHLQNARAFQQELTRRQRERAGK